MSTTNPATAGASTSKVEAKNDLAALLDEPDERLAARFRMQPITRQEWNEFWKKTFDVQRIGHFVIRPSWKEVEPEPGVTVFCIDPGMAFGTGTHPTTALCGGLMEKFIPKEAAVLDVGTGSGILLIAAEKLGASRLAGLDLDPTADAIARANLIQNRVAPERFSLACGYLIDAIDARFDLVVANILADVIIELLDQVPRVLEPGGILIGSGIIQAHRDKVARKMESVGIQVLQIEERGEWVAIAGRLR
jgi:ribosomal protein L11 methyltransferase